MESSGKANKITGTVSAGIGMLCLLALLIFDKSKLIFPDHDYFVIKYYKVILLLNGGILFIAFGTLLYLGILVPYFSANKYEKAKSNLSAGVLSLPVWLITAIALLKISNDMFFQGYWRFLIVLWMILMILFGWLMLSSLNTLRGRGKE